MGSHEDTALDAAQGGAVKALFLSTNNYKSVINKDG